MLWKLIVQLLINKFTFYKNYFNFFILFMKFPNNPKFVELICDPLKCEYIVYGFIIWMHL